MLRHITLNQFDIIQSDKRPQFSGLVNLTDYSLECPEGLRRFSAFIHFLDDSSCLWANIFSKTRAGALSQVLLKFADCGDYISSINLHESEI